MENLTSQISFLGSSSESLLGAQLSALKSLCGGGVLDGWMGPASVTVCLSWILDLMLRKMKG